MKILIYGINYAPELTGIGKYTGEMAEYFAAAGDEVEVITAPPYYPQWQIGEGYANTWKKEVINGVRVLRAPLYVPKRVTGLTRILHEISFACSSLRYWVPRYFRSYDVILCISPPFHTPLPALPHRWLHGTPVVNHVQDLQVDAAQKLNMLRHPALLGLLTRTESWLLRRLDRVSTISHGMLRNLAGKGIREDRLIYFPNWTDATSVYPLARSESLRTEWGYTERDRVVLYSGNLGKKQGLEIILQVANRLRDRQHIKFVIAGDGGIKQKLMATARELELPNLAFKPLQPRERLAAALAAADVHLVLQLKAAADLMMPSKLTNILAVGGHALVTAEPGTTLHDVVFENRLGTLTEPENAIALEAGICAILAGERDADFSGAKAYAEEYLNKENILSVFRISLHGLD